MYRFSEAVAREIEMILEKSVADSGIRHTEVYFNALKKCLAIINRNTHMGIVAEDINPDYRRFIHRNHIIFYRITESGIYIVRILEKQMDIVKHKYQ